MVLRWVQRNAPYNIKTIKNQSWGGGGRYIKTWKTFKYTSPLHPKSDRGMKNHLPTQTILIWTVFIKFKYFGDGPRKRASSERTTQHVKVGALKTGPYKYTSPLYPKSDRGAGNPRHIRISIGIHPPAPRMRCQTVAGHAVIRVGLQRRGDISDISCSVVGAVAMAGTPKKRCDHWWSRRRRRGRTRILQPPK